MQPICFSGLRKYILDASKLLVIPNYRLVDVIYLVKKYLARNVN